MTSAGSVILNFPWRAYILFDMVVVADEFMGEDDVSS